MKDPKFREEWEKLEPEYQIMLALAKARRDSHMTQVELAEMTGIHQSDISKLENGSGNPSIKTLSRLSAALGLQLKIELIPKECTGR